MYRQTGESSGLPIVCTSSRRFIAVDGIRRRVFGLYKLSGR